MNLLQSLFLLLASSALTVAAEKPNVIVILVDDMGFSDIGCYGGEIPTPNLDQLAAGGIKFSQFYNTGRCCPTRASLLTGLYPHQTGMGWMTDDQNVPGYRGRLNDQCVTLAEVMNTEGYLTAITGKWHVGQQAGVTPVSRGFQRSLNLAAGGVHFSNQTGSKGGASVYFNGEEMKTDDPRLNPPWYGTDLWTDWGLKFLDEAREEKKPFFLYLAHPAPHFPCMAPEATIAKYRGQFSKGWDVLREERYHRQIELGLIDSNWPLTPRAAGIPAWDSLSPAERKRYDDMMAIYAAMIDEVDQSVGALLAGLKQRGEYDNTLIFFLSDNGGNAETGVLGKYEGDHPGDPHSNVFVGECWAHLNNTPFRQYKHHNHEGGIATPLIAHWPAGIPAGTGWVQTPAHLIDLMATCADVGGATYPSEFKGTAITPMEGTSLRPLFSGRGLERDTLYWEHERNAAVRKGDMKLVRLGLNGPWELYDLKADRTEQHDLAATLPEVAAEMADLWEAWALRAQVKPYPASDPKKMKGKSKKTGKGKNKAPAN